MDIMENIGLNNLNKGECRSELKKCCGSAKWVEAMISLMPFASKENLFQSSEKIWNSLSEHDWKEAFTHHPKIGDLGSLRAKFSATKELSANEQSAVNEASHETLEELARLNREYENKFGFIFIVCATGKSAGEMLQIIKERINNDPALELLNAKNEQSKITKIRLEKII